MSLSWYSFLWSFWANLVSKNGSAPNWLKFSTGVHWYILISNIMFIFNIFVIHIFWANLVPKSHVLQINWNLVQGYIAICLLWYCFFSEIFVINVLGQIWSLIWISLNWFKFHRGVHSYVLITMLMFIFFQNSCHLYFLGKFGPKIRSSTKWQKLCARVYNCILITILMLIFQNYGHSHFFGQICSENLNFSKLTEIWCKVHYYYMLIMVLKKCSGQYSVFIVSKNAKLS